MHFALSITFLLLFTQGSPFFLFSFRHSNIDQAQGRFPQASPHFHANLKPCIFNSFIVFLHHNLFIYLFLPFSFLFDIAIQIKLKDASLKHLPISMQILSHAFSIHLLFSFTITYLFFYLYIYIFFFLSFFYFFFHLFIYLFIYLFIFLFFIITLPLTLCFLIISFLFVNLFSVVSLYCRFTDLSFHYSSDIGIIIMFHSATSVCVIYSCVISMSVVFVLLFSLVITMIVLPNMSSHSQMFY